MSTTPYFRTLAGIGNLGVGTTSPTSNLQVVGNAYVSNALLTTNVLATTINATTINVSSSLILSSPLPVSSGGTGTSTAVQNAVFAGPASGGSGAPAFRALASGDIPNPLSVATIYGTIAGSNTVSASNVLVASGAPASIVQGSNVAVFSNAAGTGTVVINSSGQVGIGTAAVQPVPAGAGSNTPILFVYGTSTSRGALIQTTGGSAGTANVCINTDGTNPNIELRSSTNTGSPYIDFAASNPSVDYDARIILVNNGNTFSLSSNIIQLTPTTGVGIGTASPGSPLHVYKSQNSTTELRVENPNTGTGALSQISFLTNDASGSGGRGGLAVFNSTYTAAGQYRPSGTYLYNNGVGGVTIASEAAYPIYMSTNGSERMRIDSAGNVGIGTVSPGSPLTVYGSNTAYQFSIGSYNTTLDFNCGTRFGTLAPGFTTIDPNGGSPQGLGVWDHLAINGTCAIGSSYAQTTPPANGLIVQGNVGIGITNPTKPLVVKRPGGGLSDAAIMVANNGSGTGLRIQTYDLAAQGDAYMGLGTDMWAGPFEHSIVFPDPTTPGYVGNSRMTFGKYNGTTYTTLMTLLNGGNLGIGTASPGYTLHTSGTACLGYGIYQNPNSDGDARHYITYQTAVAAGSVGTNADGRLNIQDRAGYYIRFFTGFPNGTVSLQGLIYQSGGSTLYAASSDYRIKSNVVPLSNSLDTINSLKPVSFTFNSHTEITEAGFLAHEVQEVVPNCVSGEKDQVAEDGSIIPQSLDKSYLVTHLVGAIQELSATVQSLKERIATLEKNTPTN